MAGFFLSGKLRWGWQWLQKPAAAQTLEGHILEKHFEEKKMCEKFEKCGIICSVVLLVTVSMLFSSRHCCLCSGRHGKRAVVVLRMPCPGPTLLVPPRGCSCGGWLFPIIAFSKKQTPRQLRTRPVPFPEPVLPSAAGGEGLCSAKPRAVSWGPGGTEAAR